MIKLLILADDLTGALDCGSQLKAAGANTYIVSYSIHFSFADVDENVEVLVINTMTRHLAPGKAHEVISGLVQKALQNKIYTIYKKTDSALRGNIGSELSGVLEGANGKRMFFVPAFPSLNRITKDGIQYVDGRKISETDFGNDPFEPVKESDVSLIIGQQTSVSVKLVKRNETIPHAGKNMEILLFDADSKEDMKRISEDIKQEKNPAKPLLLAGCAGFSAFLPGIIGLETNDKNEVIKKDGLLVISGTLSIASSEHIKNARKSGFDIIVIPTKKLMGIKENQDEKNTIVTSILEKYRSNNKLIITCHNEGEDVNDSCLEESELISKGLGEIIAAVYERGFFGVLMATGGDTLQGILDNMACQGLEPISEIEPGVVLSRAQIGQGKILIISKAGSIGSSGVYQMVYDYINSDRVYVETGKQKMEA